MTTQSLTDRTRTRLVGILFLAAIPAYGIGTALTTSVLSAPDQLTAVAANTPQYTLGAALMLANSVIVASIGVLLFPLLKRHSLPVARIYLVGRLVEAVVLLVGIGFLFSLVALSGELAGTADATDLATRAASAVEANDVAYQVAMAALGFASLFFCALLFRAQLVPRWLALWGIVGYAVFFAGAVLELLGVEGIGLPLSILGGLFEIAFGVWLIVRGFRSPVASVRAHSTQLA
ncbi:DUF4386 domain-containing protein [Mycetocola sp. 2940]|uniref:DUF4386 domain-containing protein n=1 Tax=Mycetocola sp. 2940 TaxID=3156452 RepID=UPI00339B601F